MTLAQKRLIILLIIIIVGVVSKFAIKPSWAKKYSVQMTDEIGKVYKDISYGEGEANKFDLYVPTNGGKESYGLVVYLHAGGYHIDKIAISGGSAGGTLAMLYAYRDAMTTGETSKPDTIRKSRLTEVWRQSIRQSWNPLAERIL